VELDLKRAWGSVEELCITADTDTALVAGLTVAMTDSRKIEGFVKPSQDTLLLLWNTDGAIRNSGLFVPFVAPIDKPEDAVMMVVFWLERTAEWPDELPDTDGNLRKGFNISKEADTPYWHWLVAAVRTRWIVYGK